MEPVTLGSEHEFSFSFVGKWKSMLVWLVFGTEVNWQFGYVPLESETTCICLNRNLDYLYPVRTNLALPR
jgi:hypothetical protein